MSEKPREKDRFEEVLRRMLNTPPTPHKPKSTAKKPAKTKKDSPPRPSLEGLGRMLKMPPKPYTPKPKREKQPKKVI
jgi:hypothetical protein